MNDGVPSERWIYDEFETYVSMHHTDAAQVLYVTAPSTWAQMGFENLFRMAGRPLEKVVHGEVHYPLVNHTIDHKRPLRLGDKVRVRTYVKWVGRRSYTVETQVFGPDDALAAVVRHTGVAVDRNKGEAVVEDWIRELAAPAGVVKD